MKPLSKSSLAYIGLCVVLTSSAFWAGRLSVAGGTFSSAIAGASGSSASASGSAAQFAGGANSAAAMSLDGFLKGSVHPNADDLARWAKSLSPDDCAAAMSQLQSLPAGLLRDTVLKAVINAWAQRDPKSFLAALGTVTVPRLREGGVTAALGSLAAANPQDALDWIKQNTADTSNRDLGRRYAAAFGGYAATDPQGAITLAAGLDESSRNGRQIKTQAMEGIANSLSDLGKFTDAAALFSQLPTGQVQNDAIAQLTDRWAQISPADTAAWLATVPSAAIRSDSGQNLTDNWTGSDPQAAATWAAQMDQLNAAAGVNVNNGDSLLSHAIDIWSRYDLNAAGQYLNQLPASPSKDSAIASFADRAAQDNPGSAMQWVATIQDPQTRQDSTQQVAKQWAKQDPAAFNQFLSTTTTLTDQQKTSLLNSVQNNGRKGGGGGQGQGNNNGG